MAVDRSSTGNAGVTRSKRGSGISVASLAPPNRARARSTARSAAVASAMTLTRANLPMRPSAAVSGSERSRRRMAPARRSSDGAMRRATSPLATTGAEPASSRPGLSSCMEARPISPASWAAAATRAQARP